jgi:CheY-like chemotaxis protein
MSVVSSSGTLAAFGSVNTRGMNGDELARRLRLMQPDLPVVYLTGFSERLFVERRVLWQGEAFLDKPCTPKGLLEAVSLVRSTFSIAADVAH